MRGGGVGPVEADQRDGNPVAGVKSTSLITAKEQACYHDEKIDGGGGPDERKGVAHRAAGACRRQQKAPAPAG